MSMEQAGGAATHPPQNKLPSGSCRLAIHGYLQHVACGMWLGWGKGREGEGTLAGLRSPARDACREGAGPGREREGGASCRAEQQGVLHNSAQSALSCTVLHSPHSPAQSCTILHSRAHSCTVLHTPAQSCGNMACAPLVTPDGGFCCRPQGPARTHLPRGALNPPMTAVPTPSSRSSLQATAECDATQQSGIALLQFVGRCALA